MNLKQIIELCQQGDREAFGLLYTATKEHLRAICQQYVTNDAIVDDLLHDTYLLIFSRIGELKDASKGESWMSTVTRNVARLYLRDHKPHLDLELSDTEEPLTPSAPELDYNEIMACINSLPQSYRRVFRLSVFEGMSHQKIAELLNIEPHTSSAQLSRAKLLLRRWLQPMVLLLLAVLLPLGVWWWAMDNDCKAVDSGNRAATDGNRAAADGNKAAADGNRAADDGNRATADGNRAADSGAATPLPSRGGVPEGRGGVSPRRLAKLQTPPLTSPLEGRGVAAPPQVTTSTEPAVTSTEPAATSTEPTATSTESAVTSTESAAISTEPAAISSEPAATFTEPATTSTEPAATSADSTRSPLPSRGGAGGGVCNIPIGLKSKSTPNLQSKNTPNMQTKSANWTADITYSGINNKSNLQLPYATADTNDAIYDSVAHHRMPFTVGLTVGRRLNRHWWAGIGVQYVWMTSDMESGNSYARLVQQQHVHYLGLPLSVEWHQQLTRRLNFYTAANVTLQLPLLSTLDSHYVLNGNATETTTEHLHPGTLWSAGVGLGLQYDVTFTVGFFVEPRLQHYFQNSSGVETWQTEHKAALSVPFGLRITF